MSLSVVAKAMPDSLRFLLTKSSFEETGLPGEAEAEGAALVEEKFMSLPLFTHLRAFWRGRN